MAIFQGHSKLKFQTASIVHSKLDYCNSLSTSIFLSPK